MFSLIFGFAFGFLVGFLSLAFSLIEKLKTHDCTYDGSVKWVKRKNENCSDLPCHWAIERVSTDMYAVYDTDSFETLSKGKNLEEAIKNAHTSPLTRSQQKYAPVYAHTLQIQIMEFENSLSYFGIIRNPDFEKEPDVVSPWMYITDGGEVPAWTIVQALENIIKLKPTELKMKLRLVTKDEEEKFKEWFSNHEGDLQGLEHEEAIRQAFFGGLLEKQKGLPEWYQMAKSFFKEISVYSSKMYDEMNGSAILLQIQYAAEREQKRNEEIGVL